VAMIASRTDVTFSLATVAKTARIAANPDHALYTD
jgi:hypothetical protein